MDKYGIVIGTFNQTLIKNQHASFSYDNLKSNDSVHYSKAQPALSLNQTIIETKTPAPQRHLLTEGEDFVEISKLSVGFTAKEGVPSQMSLTSSNNSQKISVPMKSSKEKSSFIKK